MDALRPVVSRRRHNSISRVTTPHTLCMCLQKEITEAPPPDLDAEMEAMIKEMQLFNLYKTQPPMLAFILCKEDRQTLFFDRQKVRLVGNDQVELRFKMCALCRKGNLELKKLYAAYWPYRP